MLKRSLITLCFLFVLASTCVASEVLERVRMEDYDHNADSIISIVCIDGKKFVFLGLLNERNVVGQFNVVQMLGLDGRPEACYSK